MLAAPRWLACLQCVGRAGDRHVSWVSTVVRLSSVNRGGTEMSNVISAQEVCDTKKFVTPSVASSKEHMRIYL
jgi:hypothetical protein